MKIAIIGLVVIMLVGCGEQYQNISEQSALLSDANVLAGKEVFENFGCIGCHGDDARTSALGVSRIIAEIETKRDIENALFTLKNEESDRKSIMKDQAQALSTQNILDVAAYIDLL